MKKYKKRTISILLLVFFLIPIFNNIAYSIDENIVEYQKERYDDNVHELNKKGKSRILIELEKAPLIYYENNLTNSNTLKWKKRELLNYQEDFKNHIFRSSIDIKFLDSYSTLINGFSCVASSESIDTIKRNPMVKNIHILNEIERPDHQYRKLNIEDVKELVDESKNYGSETVIAIIDTGFDPYHEAMNISDDVDVKLTESDVEILKSKINLQGKYFSEKIPYGYNYFDNNTEIRDLGYKSEHGIHVSGIAVGNSQEFKGQAPEAQLLAMKVFSNNPSFPSTFEDIYIKAIEDAVIIGADVINLSLGTPSGFSMEESVLSKVINTAVDNGIICTTSAGNEGDFLYGKGDPLLNDGDIGTIGSPSIISNTLSVGASFMKEEEEAVRMADFSSWGTGPLLEMKPEITGPGVNIYSTLGNNEYGLMDGTSMAAPYVAGNIAELKKHIEKENYIIDGNKKEIADLTKIVAMNTSDIIYDGYNNPYSPRVQGAGGLNLDNGLNFNAIVLERNSGLPKVELKTFDNTNFSIPLRIKNYSLDNIEYKVKINVLVNDTKEIDMETTYNLLNLVPLEGVTITGPSTIEVHSGSLKDIDFNIDFTNAVDQYGNLISKNQFIEGFIILQPVDSSYSEISIPYTGFYGDWLGENSPRIFDGMDKFREGSIYKSAGFIDNNGDYAGYIPGQGYYKSEQRIAISPDNNSEIQSIVPVLSYLRNCEETRFNILDENGRVLKRLTTDKYIRKNYFSRGNNRTSRVNPNSTWDGKINGKIVEDGVYYYQIEGRLQGNNVWQEKKYPVIVDTKVPEISNLIYEDGEIKWTASDIGSGLSHFFIYVDGENILGRNKVYATNGVKEGDFTHRFNEEVNNHIKIIGLDCAGNISERTLTIGEDINGPEVYITKPEIFSIFSENKVLIEGYALDESKIEEITINGENVDFQYVYSSMKYEFTYVLEDLEDGVQNITIGALDEWGNKIEYSFIIYIDTLEPILKIENTNMYKYMPGGGRTIIVENNAYDMDYFKTLPNMAELLSREDTCVKLSKDTFIDKNGLVISIDRIPELNYYSDHHNAIYNKKDGSIKSISTKIEVGDNLGVFTVYVNGSEYYNHDEGKLIDLKPVIREIDLDIPICDDLDQLIIEIVDIAGNIRKETIKIVGN